LRQEGYSVEVAASGAEALNAATREEPDLVLLDVALPDLSGVEVCRRLRSFSQAPVVFLTARRQEVDKIVGLDAGGDDYVVKPVQTGKLLARVRAQLRRSRVNASRRDEAAPGELRLGELTVNLAARRVWVRGASVELSAREFDLLRMLALNAGRVVSRRALFEGVWGLAGPAVEAVGLIACERMGGRPGVEHRPRLAEHPNSARPAPLFLHPELRLEEGADLVHRRERDPRALGQLADVPGFAGLEQQRVEHLGRAPPVDAADDAGAPGRDRPLDQVQRPRQLEVQAPASVPVAHLVPPQQRSTRFGDGGRGDERHVRHRLLEPTCLGKPPDGLPDVARVAARLRLDQEADGTTLHLADDGEVVLVVIGARFGVDGPDLHVRQPGEGLADLVGEVDGGSS